jgi:hypothetical protein
MEKTDIKTRVPKQKISYLAISSLVLSILTAAVIIVLSLCDVVLPDYIPDSAVLLLICVYVLLSFAFGVAALYQRCSWYYPRLWWLAIFGVAISGLLIVLSVIGLALVLYADFMLNLFY